MEGHQTAFYLTRMQPHLPHTQKERGDGESFKSFISRLPFQTRFGLHLQTYRAITTKMHREAKTWILCCCDSTGPATLVKVVPLLESNYCYLGGHFDHMQLLPFVSLFRTYHSPVSVNAVLLKHSHTYSFMYHVWPLSHDSNRAEWLGQTPYGPQSQNYLLSGPLPKKVAQRLF